MSSGGESPSTEAEEVTKKPEGDEIINDDEWNVDDHRGDHESDEHWELRRQFMVTNKDSYPMLRILSLSQVFSNMEFLGCKYPIETMELVSELSVGIVEEYRKNRKGRLQRTFVKASDAAERKSKGMKRSADPINTTSVSKPPANKLLSQQTVVSPVSSYFVPASPNIQNSTSTNSSSLNSSAVTFNQGFQNCRINDLIMQSDRCPETSPIQESESPMGFWSDVSCEEVSFSSVPTNSTPIPVTAPRMSQSQIQSLSDVDGEINPENLKRLESALHFYGESIRGLVLVEYPESPGESPLQIIHRSFAMCHKEISIVLNDDPKEGYRCSISTDNKLLAEGTSFSREGARAVAAEPALVALKRVCYTIQVNNTHPDMAVSKNELDDAKTHEKNVLTSENNIGAKLLKLMGWSGSGGLGKNEQGIEQPISVSKHEVIGRSRLGLGSTSIGKDFPEAIRKFLESQMTHFRQRDLRFTADFDSDERKVIHFQSQRLGLKSRSYGKGENRYLVVSLKPKVQTLLQELLQSGDTNKYKVFYPEILLSSELEQWNTDDQP